MQLKWPMAKPSTSKMRKFVESKLPSYIYGSFFYAMQHHTSIWEQETYFRPRDVIIIGGGLVGLWSAYHLKKANPSLNILIIEKGNTPLGASTRNAGFACFGSVTELVHDARELGQDNMLQLVQWRYEGLQRLLQVFRKKQIGYEALGGYELIAANQYESEAALRNDIGWLNILMRKTIRTPKVFKLKDRKIKDFGFKQTAHLIHNKLEGQLHAGKLVQSLQKRVQEMGVETLYQTSVHQWEKEADHFLVHTDMSHSLRCQQLLLCTNAFATELVPQLQVTPARGQILVTSPIKNLPFTGSFHFDEGYYYFRNLGNRVLLGGARNQNFESEATTDFDITTEIQQTLETFLRTHILPKKKFTIEHRWSGIMGMGAEKMPIVKQLDTDLYCAVRMSGMGVALAPLVGETVANMMRR
jgi:gamma-glutamylputrescine oxidase